VVFPFGKLMLQRPVMGIGFNEVELKNNLIGYYKVTIFYSRQWKNENLMIGCFSFKLFSEKYQKYF
jgi:hypothetical protein